MGNIGFDNIKKDGNFATLRDLTDIRQTLDQRTGCIYSHFQVEGAVRRDHALPMGPSPREWQVK